MPASGHLYLQSHEIHNVVVHYERQTSCPQGRPTRVALQSP
jgi:hypothetical protein